MNPTKKGPTTCVRTNAFVLAIGWMRAFSDCETETKGWTPVPAGEIPSMTSGARALKGEATPTTAE